MYIDTCDLYSELTTSNETTFYIYPATMTLMALEACYINLTIMKEYV